MNKILQAIEGKKIKLHTKNEFIDFINYSCDLYAIERITNKALLEILFQFVNTNYSQMSYEELNLALNMNLNNEFKNTIEIYGKLTVPFLAKIMEQYRPVRRTAIKYSTPEAETKTITDDEKVFTGFMDSCQKIGEVLMVHNWAAIYRHLVKLGQVPDAEGLKKLHNEKRGEMVQLHRVVGSAVNPKVDDRVKKIVCQNYAFDNLAIRRPYADI